MLAAAELTAVTITLAASVPILAHAANYGTAWGAPALAGALVALALLVPVTLALLLVETWQWRARASARRNQADMPSSARTPLWRAGDALFEDYAAEYMSEARYSVAYAMGEAGATGRHSAPRPVRSTR
jgi:hypothetical protein